MSFVVLTATRCCGAAEAADISRCSKTGTDRLRVTSRSIKRAREHDANLADFASPHKGCSVRTRGVCCTSTVVCMFFHRPCSTRCRPSLQFYSRSTDMFWTLEESFVAISKPQANKHPPHCFTRFATAVRQTTSTSSPCTVLCVPHDYRIPSLRVSCGVLLPNIGMIRTGGVAAKPPSMQPQRAHLKGRNSPPSRGCPWRRIGLSCAFEGRMSR